MKWEYKKERQYHQESNDVWSYSDDILRAEVYIHKGPWFKGKERGGWDVAFTLFPNTERSDIVIGKFIDPRMRKLLRQYGFKNSVNAEIMDYKGKIVFKTRARADETAMVLRKIIESVANETIEHFGNKKLLQRTGYAKFWDDWFDKRKAPPGFKHEFSNAPAQRDSGYDVFTRPSSTGFDVLIFDGNTGLGAVTKIGPNKKKSLEEMVEDYEGGEGGPNRFKQVYSG